MPILDADGNEAKPPVVMPDWHKDVKITTLMTWCGNWFEFAGIDPEHDPDIVFFRYKGPTSKTKKRKERNETRAGKV